MSSMSNLPTEKLDIIREADPNVLMEFMSTISVFTNPKVKINNSHVHGRGLFATSKINSGEQIAMYPQDVLIRRKNDMFSICEGNAGKEYVKKFHKRQKKGFKFMEYATFLFMDNDEMVYTFGDPEEYHPPGFSAHLINDAADIAKVDKNPADASVASEYFAYKVNTKKKKNSKFKKIHLNGHTMCSVVAIRDISPGEEILVEYGYPYWSNVSVDKIENLIALHMSKMSSSQKQLIAKLIE